jgi:hypothetical protein
VELGPVGGKRTGETLAVPAETVVGTMELVKVGLGLGLGLRLESGLGLRSVVVGNWLRSRMSVGGGGE